MAMIMSSKMAVRINVFAGHQVMPTLTRGVILFKKIAKKA
jgi:hypothetical protein